MAENDGWEPIHPAAVDDGWEPIGSTSTAPIGEAPPDFGAAQVKPGEVTAGGAKLGQSVLDAGKQVGNFGLWLPNEIASGLGAIGTGVTTGSLNQAADVARDWSAPPFGEATTKLGQGVNYPFEKYGELAQGIREHAEDAGHPALGAIAETAANILPLAIGHAVGVRAGLGDSMAGESAPALKASEQVTADAAPPTAADQLKALTDSVAEAIKRNTEPPPVPAPAIPATPVTQGQRAAPLQPEAANERAPVALGGNGSASGTAPTPEAAARAAAVAQRPDATPALPAGTPVDASQSVPVAGGVSPTGPEVVAPEISAPIDPTTIAQADWNKLTPPEKRAMESKWQAAQEAAMTPEQRASRERANVARMAGREPTPNTASAPPVEQNVPRSDNPITARFEQKMQDYPAAKAEYAANPDTKGGTVLNTDTARELSPDYLSDRTKSADVHEPASAFIKQLYAEKLAEPTPEGKDKMVLFTAGGTGAGKSTGLAKIESTVKPEITYDTNMDKYDSAKSKVEQALGAGRDVTIVYTYRDPVEALRMGALKRSMRQEAEFGSGRTVPMSAHLGTHTGSFDVAHRLAKEYTGDSRVKIVAVDNSLGKDNAQVVTLDRIPNPRTEGLNERLHQQLDEARAAGEISSAIHAGFKAKSSREVGLDSPGVRGQLEPQRPQREAAPAASAKVDDGGVAVAERPVLTKTAPEVAKPETPADTTVAETPGTQVRNAAVDAQRDSLGLSELPQAEREHWQDASDKAGAGIANGDIRPRALAAEVAAKPRALTTTETMALAHDLKALSDEHANATRDALAARDRGDTVGQTQALLRQSAAVDAMETNHAALRNGGTEAARSLSIRNAILKDDYTVGRNMDRARLAFGDKFNDALKTQVEDLSAQLKAAQDRAAKLESEANARTEAAKARKAADNMTPDEKAQAAIQKQMDRLQKTINDRLMACPI